MFGYLLTLFALGTLLAFLYLIPTYIIPCFRWMLRETIDIFHQWAGAFRSGWQEAREESKGSE